MEKSLCLISLFLSLTHSKEFLPSCNKKFNKLTLCSNEKYVKSYPSKDWPLKLTQHLSIYEVVQFNDIDKTVTIFLELMTQWNDTRLFLKTDQKITK